MLLLIYLDFPQFQPTTSGKFLHLHVNMNQISAGQDSLQNVSSRNALKLFLQITPNLYLHMKS